MSDRDAAIALRRSLHERVCDRHEPWPLGVAVFCSEHPDLYDANGLRLEVAAPDAEVEEVVRWADALLDGFAHRRVEVFDEATGARLRGGFEARGWHPEVLIWMVHDGPPPAAPDLAVVPAADERIRPLRRRWVEPPFDAQQVADHIGVDEAVGRRLGARNLVIAAGGEDGEPLAYSRYVLLDDLADVQNVFVAPEHRGRGLGAALTAATVAQAFADGARRVFIVADAEERPRHLYARLGFRPVWTSYEFLRMPAGTG